MDEDTLIHALQNPDLYDYPIKAFQVIETHISWILLTGPYAYKIKKNINLGFVDFSSLDRRKFFCEEEIRLNQPFAPQLYLTIVPIVGTRTHPLLNQPGPPIEYAIKMHQFQQSSLLPQILLNHALTPNLVHDIAKQIAHFHLTTPAASLHTSFGSLSALLQMHQENFRECRSRITEPEWLEKLEKLESIGTKEFEKHQSTLEKRKNQGFIKECHGDLHLNNIIVENGKITIFDRIEFNESFRIIDVLNDLALLTMDLKANGCEADAYRLLNCYLEITGDYEGIPLLRFYESYRAMVRAKVALLSEKTATIPSSFKSYIQLGLTLLQPPQPRLVITHGAPGSGKTSLTKAISPKIPAIYLRSDIERKRLFAPTKNDDLYGKSKRDATYQRLFSLSEILLVSDISVIVDATFLKQEYRHLFQILAKRLKIPFFILNCVACLKTLSHRVKKRSQTPNASDANIEVLNQLITQVDPLTPEEQSFVIPIETNGSIDLVQLANVLKT